MTYVTEYEDYKASQVEIDELKQQLAVSNRRIVNLEEALLDAIESVESWAGYASDYFREKHDLAGDVARLTAALRGEGADDGK